MGQPVQLHQPAGCRFDYRGGDDHPDWCGRGRLSGTVDNPAWGIDSQQDASRQIDLRCHKADSRDGHINAV